MKKQKGQLIIITLLLLATFALVGASVTTQMVFEQKKAALEEKTQKAYYAAESGIEKAIQSLNRDEDISTNKVNITLDTSYQLGSTQAGGGQTFSLPGMTSNPGQPLYLDLTRYTVDALTVCWDTDLSSIQATLLYTAAGVVNLAHFAANATVSQNPQINGGTTAAFGSDCGMTGIYYATLTFNLPLGAVPNFITIIPLFASTRLGIQTSGATVLPTQGSFLSSTGTVPELDTQVTRRVKYFYSTAHFPPYYLLYSFFGAGGVTYGAGKNW